MRDKLSSDLYVLQRMTSKLTCAFYVKNAEVTLIFEQI